MYTTVWRTWGFVIRWAASQYQCDAKIKLVASGLRVRSVMHFMWYWYTLQKYCLRSNRWIFVVHSSDCVATPPLIVMVLFAKLFIPVINSVVISSLQFLIPFHLFITTVEWVTLWKSNHIRTLFSSVYGDEVEFPVLYCNDRIPCHEYHCTFWFDITIILQKYPRNPLL